MEGGIARVLRIAGLLLFTLGVLAGLLADCLVPFAAAYPAILCSALFSVAGIAALIASRLSANLGFPRIDRVLFFTGLNLIVVALVSGRLRTALMIGGAAVLAASAVCHLKAARRVPDNAPALERRSPSGDDDKIEQGQNEQQ